MADHDVIAVGDSALIGSSWGTHHDAESRVARGTAPGGTARKGPTGRCVTRRGGGGGTPRQDPRLRASRTNGNSRSGSNAALAAAVSAREPGAGRVMAIEKTP